MAEASYWKRVHRAAWQEAKMRRGGSALDAIGGIIGVGGIFWSLLKMGDKTAANESVVEHGVFLAVFILILVLSYLHWIKKIPEEWDRQKTNEIAQLEAQRAPKLKLSFHPHEDGIDEVPVKFPVRIFTSTGDAPANGFEDTIGTYLRARVNVACAKSALGCAALLTRLQKQSFGRQDLVRYTSARSY